MQKPSNIHLDNATLRPTRTRADGRWYWRADTTTGGRTVTIWCGWGTPEEVGRLHLVDSRPEAVEPQTVAELLDAWIDRLGRDADPRFGPARTHVRRLSAVLGPVPVALFVDAMLPQFRSIRLRAGASQALAGAEMASMRLAWAWARDNGVVHRQQATGREPCVECGRPSAHSHHVVPVSRAGRFTVRLCEGCHDLVHEVDRNSLRAQRLRNATNRTARRIQAVGSVS